MASAPRIPFSLYAHAVCVLNYARNCVACLLLKVLDEAATWRKEYLYGGPVKMLPLGLVLKAKHKHAEEEAKTIEYVRERTRIPLPHMILSASGPWGDYMLMKRAEGELVLGVWSRLSEAERASIIEHLRVIVAELRALSPPNDKAISGVNGGTCLDGRVAGRPFGPFSNEAEFNDHLIKVTRPFLDDELLSEIRPKMIDTHRIVLTHGDIAPRNIIVKDGKVSALIDWENAGWYPEHWEYVKAKYHHELDKSWDMALRVIISQDYEQDLAVDEMLTKYMVGAL